jgi:hypothetical protein
MSPNEAPSESGFSNRRRQLSAVIGAFLVLVAVGAATALGGDILSEPLIAVQLIALALAGVCDLIAAIDRLPAGSLAWYQWSGLGNICLAVALPLAFVGGEVFLFGLMMVGGLSLAAMGVDMLVFHGEYTRGNRLNGARNSR